MIRIRGVNRTIGLFAAVLFFSTLVFAQGKAPAAKSNATGMPLQVQVAVFPDHNMPEFARNAASVLPVVIFGSATFNAGDVNTETLAVAAPKLEFFGTNGKSACRTEDVNRDGRIDLVCTVQTNATRAKPGTSFVAVEGQMLDGARFRGEFSLKLLPGPPTRPAPAKH